MKRSPCYDCEGKDRDKNCPECTMCQPRIDYVDAMERPGLQKSFVNDMEKYKFPEIEEITDMKKNYKRWNDAEDRVLHENYLMRSNAELGEMLDRRPSAIANRLNIMGLSRVEGVRELMEKINDRKPDGDDQEKGGSNGQRYLKFVLNTESHGDLYDRFIDYARAQYRTPKYQILYLISQAVEAHEREHPPE